jgi:hypothetical protein
MHDATWPGAELGFLARVARATTRRQFLQVAGLTVGVLAVGCSDDTLGPDDSADLGSGDTAVLNLAYALEQMDSAFFTQATLQPYSGGSAEELRVLRDIRAHEVAHRDLLKGVLGDAAIGELEFDFTMVDFTSRDSVLTFAAKFEDLGVAAYNGGGPLLTNAANLLLTGKIVSVEARQAATIRDLLQPRSALFAGDDVVDADGLDRALAAAAVLAQADPFIVPSVSDSGLVLRGARP